jgi:tryptophanyl-tRNA synthetase
LREGARKARAIAAPRLEIMRRAVGLGTLGAPSRKAKRTRKADRRARIVSFRDDEGFRFRLLGADGEELLLSRPFADPKIAGSLSKALVAAGDPAITMLDATRFAVAIDEDRVAASPAFADTAARDEAIGKLRVALASLRETG